MKKANVWDLINKEAVTIITAIEKGEIKTRKEYQDYLETVYNWRISDAIESIVGLYLSVNHVEMDFDNETT